METRSRPALGAASPGTDPAVLRLITVAVLAGLVVSGMTVIYHHGQAPGRNPGQAGAAMAPLSARAASARVPDTPALRLLGQAARACLTMSYQGVEVLHEWGSPGPATSVVDVWHAPGGVTLAQPVTLAPLWSGQARHIAAPASALGGQALLGSAMLGMSQQLVALLAANYRVAAVAFGQVARRPARVLTVRRQSGALAARIWLDKATALPLRRQMFDARGALVSDAAFAVLLVGRQAAGHPPGTAPRQWVTAWPARLRQQGWPLPGALPGNLVLLAAREHSTPQGPVIDLDYSDGLSLVSVFLLRGHLPSRLTGWARVVMAGCPVYADDSSGQTLIWSAQGFEYTLVATAPPQTVAQVVAALPHDGSPGLLARLHRGLHRLLSWLTP